MASPHATNVRKVDQITIQILKSFLELRALKEVEGHISFIGDHSIQRFAFNSGNTNQHLLKLVVYSVSTNHLNRSDRLDF